MIWIDITNTPHVLFFKKYLEENDDYLVTCRDHAEIVPLLKKLKIKHIVVGKHEGKGKINKILGLIKRNIQLIKIIKKNIPLISYSCGSPYAAQVSFLMGIPHVAYMDNETAKFSNYLTLPFCAKLYIPEAIPKKLFSRYFISKNRIEHYEGFKESEYLENLKPDENVLKQLGLNKSDKIALIRPELTTALYYKGKDSITYEVVRYLAENTDYKIVFLARTKDERKMFKEYNSVIIPDSIDAPSLMKFCKFVMSGGGTMNREACILGVPAFTTYPLDSMLSVDKYFVKKGKMKHIKSLEEFKRLIK